MGLFEIFKRKNQTPPTVETLFPSNTKYNGSDQLQHIRTEQKQFRNAAIPGVTPSSYEYNSSLIESYRLWHSDSIVKRQVWIYASLMTANGFQIVSSDKQIEAKVNNRLKEIQFNSNTTVEQLIRDLVVDFVQTGNQFGIFNRSDNASGRPYKFNGKVLKPISSIFRGNPASFYVQRDIYGNPISYKHDVTSIINSYSFHYSDPWKNSVNGSVGSVNPSQTTFSKYDVQHFKYDEDIVTGFGRPFYYEAIDDILLLRKIEGVIEELITSGRILQLVYKVGTDRYPAMSQKEIDTAKYVVESQEPYSFLTVPHNHDVKMESTNVLEHMLQFYDKIRHRVYGQLGVGQVFMGESETSNKASQNVIGEFLYQQVRDMQMLFQSQFQVFVIEHILLDQNYNPKRLGKQMPQFVFNDPSMDVLIKKQNQAVFLFEHSQVTRSEMREMLGLTNIRESDEHDMYIYRVKIPSSVAIKRESANEQPDIEHGKETENKIMPQNQYTKNSIDYQLGEDGITKDELKG